MERKVIAHVQVRPGPYRVGPHGLLQPLADVHQAHHQGRPDAAVRQQVPLPVGAVPRRLHGAAFHLGDSFRPDIDVAGHNTWMQLTDLNIGVLFILAVSSMGVYGIALAGWASNNKYALLGGLRSSAQMISYELPLSLAIAAPLLLSNTLSLREHRASGSIRQHHCTGTSLRGPFPQIVSFIIFLIAAFAETNRMPFDLPEAENELVAGFHTEYSSMKFASFFMAEYANMVTVSSMATLLFLGGWMAPWPAELGLELRSGADFPALPAWSRFYHGCHRRAPAATSFTLPVFGVLFLSDGRRVLLAHRASLADAAVLVLRQNRRAFFSLFIWIRGTLPRFRYDQLMGFAWKFLFPGGDVEPAGDRVSWWPGFHENGLLKWTSSFFCSSRSSRWSAPSMWWCRRIPFRAPSRWSE